MTPETLSILALISFGFGAVAAIAGFRFEAWRNNAIQLTAVGLGMAFKTAAIGVGCVMADNHLFNSSSEIYGLLAWALGFSLLVALAVSAARSLSAVILPIVVLLMILALVSSRQTQDTGIAPPGRLFPVHLLTAFLGYGLFLTACGASVLYLEQASLLKRKIFGAIFKDLPSLERLEHLELLCAWLGLLAFGIAIGTGAVLASSAGKPFWTDPKTISALLTWAIFGALAIGRAARWMNGRAAARFVLAGAGLVLVTFALSHGFERPQGTVGAREQAVGADTAYFPFSIVCLVNPNGIARRTTPKGLCNEAKGCRVSGYPGSRRVYAPYNPEGVVSALRMGTPSMRTPAQPRQGCTEFVAQISQGSPDYIGTTLGFVTQPRWGWRETA